MIEHIAQTISIVIIAVNTALLSRAVRKNEELMSERVDEAWRAQKEIDGNRKVILSISNRVELNSRALKLHAERLAEISAANRDNDNFSAH